MRLILLLLLTVGVVLGASSYALEDKIQLPHFKPLLTPESRSATGISVLGRSDPTKFLTLHIALKQQRLDELEQLVKEVSDPSHSKYGQYLSRQEVTNLVGSSAVTVQAVRDWLSEINGIQEVKLLPSGDFLSFRAPVSVVETLFAIQLHDVRHKHAPAATFARSLQPVSIPASLSAHIDHIGGLDVFPILRHSQMQMRTRAATATEHSSTSPEELEVTPSTASVADNTTNCGLLTSCSSCLADSNCGWCPGTQTCHNGTLAFPTEENLAWCPGYNYNDTTACDTCAQHVTCDACLSDSANSCGYCPTTQTCHKGTSLGIDDPEIICNAFAFGASSSSQCALSGPSFEISLSSDKIVTLLFQDVCPNGLPANNTNHPCKSNSPDTSIVGYHVDIIQDGSQRETMFIDTRDVYSFGLNRVMTLSGMKNYVKSIVKVRTEFASGLISLPSASSLMVPTAYITREPILQQYQVPPQVAPTSVLQQMTTPNSQAVTEFIGQFYSPADLSFFLQHSGLANSPSPVHLFGPNNASTPGGEATLDLEYILAVAPNVNTTFWSVSQNDGDGWLEAWLAQLSSMDTIPWVHSVSYGEPEGFFAPSYLDRCNNEFMKLAARGITILIASGDNGVADEPDQALCRPFTPDFPSTSPYVLTVGASMISTASSPICSADSRLISYGDNCEVVGERACSVEDGALISTGGGFSNHFSQPAYQTPEINSYLSSNRTPPSDYFNVTGRAYPDVAALGHQFLIYLSGAWGLVDGTSAAAPVFAGVITHLNQRRLENNLPTMGFINPWFYAQSRQHPGIFTDITVGRNNCYEGYKGEGYACCEEGFEAIVGWDPLGGLGTPKFAQMVSIDRVTAP